MHRKIVLSVIAVAALFGLNISGCNRDRSRTTSSRTTTRSPSARSVRPAEVLSASAYRPPSHVYGTPVPAPSRSYAQTPAYSPAPTHAPAPTFAYAPQPQPYHQPQPVVYHTAPVQPAVSSPQLAMAQAHVQPIPLAPMPTHQTGPRLQPLQYTPQPTYQAPPRPMQQVMYAQAPLPELEPMRAYRLPTTRGSARPIAEVMVSERAAQLEYEQQMDGQEIRRALAPLAPTPIAYAPANAWVSSPTTAMYTPGTR